MLTTVTCEKGTILIVTLWILAILTVFAVALGQQASLEIKLAEYQRDKLRARELAKAAIERALWEKANDPVQEVDALSESWTNNELLFKDFKLGKGTFSLSYALDGAKFYGMEDEQSKINLNKAEKLVLQNLFKDYDDAEEMATAIVAWRSKIDIPQEDYYYQNLDFPYTRKRGEFRSLEELLLVRGITPKVLYGEDKNADGKISEDEEGLVQYLTIYGDGKVNINTASEKVLTAIISGAFPDFQDQAEALAKKIVDYRNEGEGAGDNWFAIGTDTVTIASGLTKEVKNLARDIDPDGIFEGNEWAKLKQLASGEPKRLCVSSNIYTIHAQAQVKRVKKIINTTVVINSAAPYLVEYLSWHGN